MKQNRVLIYTIALSLMLHGLFAAYRFQVLSRLSSAFVKKEKKNETKFTYIDQKELQEIKAKLKNQIVDTHDSNRTPPEKEFEAFQGEKDNYFDRQTVSKNVGIFKKANKAAGARSETEPQRELGASPLKKAEKVSKASSAKTANGYSDKFDDKKFSLSDLAVKSEKNLEDSKKTESTPETRGSNQKFDSDNKVAQSNDYVQDVQLGDLTHLNTKEFKYYGFYFRIKQQLEQFWGASVQEKIQEIYRSGRRVASSDKVTSLIVQLDEKGMIKNIAVKGSSGLSELDQVAVDAFNKAGPFPNPPKGMMENGVAVIEWGFVLRS